VFAHLTKASRHSFAYRRVLQDFSLAISFQTGAELLAADYSSARQRRLDALVEESLHLPHSAGTSAWYADTSRIRRALKQGRERGGDAGDADVWIISSALVYRTILMSHDGHQVALGRGLGLIISTALPRYRAGNPA
jgi:predicted nucleic acid-binding protein